MILIIENYTELKNQLYNWLKKKNIIEDIQNKKVFLKPNMGYPKPAPFTTSLEIIRSVVEVLNELNTNQIVIGEGSTSHSNVMDNFRATGLIKELEKYSVKYSDLDEEESIEVKLNERISHFLPKFLKEFDVRISLPVIKFYEDDYGEFFLSNAIKNFFGLPPKEKYRRNNDSVKRDSLHTNIHKSIIEIFQAVEKFAPFDLYICDGTKILIGEGAEGQPLHFQKIILSDNALEVDLKILEILKKPLPKYLRMLSQK